MDEMRTTNQVEEVNKQLKEIPKEAEERGIENQPQTGKNGKPLSRFKHHQTCRKPPDMFIYWDTNGKPKNIVTTNIISKKIA